MVHTHENAILQSGHTTPATDVLSSLPELVPLVLDGLQLHGGELVCQSDHQMVRDGAHIALCEEDCREVDVEELQTHFHQGGHFEEFRRYEDRDYIFWT